MYSDSEGAPLSLISLPSTFKSFYSGAYPTFLNLPNDVEILCWASTPPGGNLDNFTGNTVHVPVGCKDAYLNSKIWAGATIIDDLVIDRDVKTGDSSIEIEVPVNPGISADAQVTSYEVECSIVREGADTAYRRVKPRHPLPLCRQGIHCRQGSCVCRRQRSHDLGHLYGNR